MSFIPYTYYLFHIPTGKKYYGVEYKKTAHPSNLWTKYFSSSKRIKSLIKEYGKDSFVAEVRKTFETVKSAIDWEQRVLFRIKAIERDEWLNQSLSSGPFFAVGPKSEEWKEKMRKPKTEEHKRKIAESHKGIMASLKTREKLSKMRKGKIAHNKGLCASEQAKENMSKAHKGQIPWNKGKKTNQIPWNKGITNDNS